jgi:hypothetical protein
VPDRPVDVNLLALADAVSALGWECHPGAEWLVCGVPGAASIHVRADDALCCAHLLVRGSDACDLDRAAQLINRRAFASRAVVLRNEGDLSWRVVFRFREELRRTSAMRALATFVDEVKTLASELPSFGFAPRYWYDPKLADTLEAFGIGSAEG